MLTRVISGSRVKYKKSPQLFVRLLGRAAHGLRIFGAGGGVFLEVLSQLAGLFSNPISLFSHHASSYPYQQPKEIIALPQIMLILPLPILGHTIQYGHCGTSETGKKCTIHRLHLQTTICYLGIPPSLSV